MIQSEFDERVEKIVQRNKLFLDRAFDDAGSISPMAFIHSMKNGEEHVAIVALGDLFKDDESKEHVAPAIAKIVEALSQTGAIPFCFVMVVEGWVRQALPQEDLKDWKSKPITGEAVIMTVETEYSCKTHIFDIDRNGEKPTLKEVKGPMEVEGRFASLFRKYKITKN